VSLSNGTFPARPAGSACRAGNTVLVTDPATSLPRGLEGFSRLETAGGFGGVSQRVSLLGAVVAGRPGVGVVVGTAFVQDVPFQNALGPQVFGSSRTEATAMATSLAVIVGGAVTTAMKPRPMSA